MTKPVDRHQHEHLAKVVSETQCGLGPTRAGLTGHDVQFYRTDAFLTRAVVDFLASGVRVGQPIVVIATAAHRLAFTDGLRQRGLDIDELMSGRVAIWLDARDTLACFMEAGQPNRDLFEATVGSVFERVIDNRRYLVIRAYGEMVDLLWKDGNAEGAILLEQLWNELAEKHKYSLLCGYSLDNFLHEAGTRDLQRVCGHHSHALPVEQRDAVA